MAEQYFSFIIAGQECAIDSDKVLEIVDELMITSLPLSPAYMFGVANFRGEIVGVIDLAKFLEQGIAKNDSTTIVCSSDRGSVALVVDSIRTIISPEAVTPVRAIGQEITLPYLDGVVMTEKGLIRILDINRMLADINSSATLQAKSVKIGSGSTLEMKED